MFDQLMELVRESGQQTVVENPEVPNEHNDAVMQEASSSIYSGLQNMMQTGGPGALKGLFEGVQSGDNNHPAVQQVANQFSGNLMQKFGLGSGAAKSIAISLIPMVLGKLMNRSKGASPDSGFSIGNILGSLMGGSGGGGMLGGMLGGLGGGQQNQQPQQSNTGGGMMGGLSSMGAKMGLDKDGDGDTDMNDLMAMFRK